MLYLSIHIVYSIITRQTEYVICLKIMTTGRKVDILQDAVISFI